MLGLLGIECKRLPPSLRNPAYAQNKHGGSVGMRARPGRTYQVRILQVVDVDQSDQGIEQLDARWKRKLLTREFGLNLN